MWIVDGNASKINRLKVQMSKNSKKLTCHKSTLRKCFKGSTWTKLKWLFSSCYSLSWVSSKAHIIIKRRKKWKQFHIHWGTWCVPCLYKAGHSLCNWFNQSVSINSEEITWMRLNKSYFRALPIWELALEMKTNVSWLYRCRYGG